MTPKQLRQKVRVSYVKVAEYQRRGALHFHVVVRLDAAQPKRPADVVEAPPAAVRRGAARPGRRAAVERVPSPHPAPTATGRVRRCGGGADRAAAVEPGRQGRGDRARYIAKYATKSTEAVGGLMHRLDASDLRTLKVRPHARRLVECAWRLGGEPHLEQLRLRRWAHALGFRGHCFTKSRRYSTTFTALRRGATRTRPRRAHHGEPRDPWGRPLADGDSVEQRRWAYTGSGHTRAGDTWLAETGAKRAAERRRVAREELSAAARGQSATNAEVQSNSRRSL